MQFDALVSVGAQKRDVFAAADVRNFIGCMTSIYARSGPWDGADFPNVGVKWKNSKTGAWGCQSINMISQPSTLTTAYTTGDSKDWGGCARGQTNWPE